MLVRPVRFRQSARLVAHVLRSPSQSHSLTKYFIIEFIELEIAATRRIANTELAFLLLTHDLHTDSYPSFLYAIEQQEWARVFQARFLENAH